MDLWIEHTMRVIEPLPPACYFNVFMPHVHFGYPDGLKWELPPEEAFAAYCRRLATQPIPAIFDIEHFKWGNMEEIEKSTEMMLTLIRWFRKYAPSVKLGSYDHGPWRYFLEWRRDRMAWYGRSVILDPIIKRLDFLCPVLYRYYSDSPTERKDWHDWSLDMCMYAKQLAGKKPVVAFTMPWYHPNAKDSGMMPLDAWQEHLTLMDTVGVDGFIFWGYLARLTESNDYVEATKPYWRPIGKKP